MACCPPSHQVRATHYDLVLNGVELGSGSLRNHRSDVQLQILEILGYSAAQARERFGFMLEAFDTGATAGFAFGFDRLCLMLAGGDSLRDVIAFPKTQRAQDMQSPNTVEPEQLRELGLRGVSPRKEAGMHSALIYTDAYVNYQHSGSHPLKPYRLRLTHELMQHYGLLQLGQRCARDHPGNTGRTRTVSHPEYLGVLRAADAGKRTIPYDRYGLGPGDNPIFPGMYAWSQLCAGGALQPHGS